MKEQPNTPNSANTAATFSFPSPFARATLADLPEFKVGHAQDSDAATGCTVIVSLEGATCSIDVRGGGPATRETDLLKPENMVEAVHATVLSGGSAFGLEAATGVMEELAARGVGFELCGLHVPIVVGACLFDLPYGKPNHPDAAMGAQATRNALDGLVGADKRPMAEGGAAERSAAEGNAAEGNVGAGCGATVGKMLDPAQAMKSGLGIYGLRASLGNGEPDLVAVAIVAVNALGTVCLPDGTPLAGHRDKADAIMDPLAPVMDSELLGTASGPCMNTTLGVVLTNANITKAQAQKVSSITHDAYARAIKPVHTSNDGDTIFTMASGKVQAPFDLVAILATQAMQGAILRAAATAQGACGLPAAVDVNPALCKQVLEAL